MSAFFCDNPVCRRHVITGMAIWREPVRDPKLDGYAVKEVRRHRFVERSTRGGIAEFWYCDDCARALTPDD